MIVSALPTSSQMSVVVAPLPFTIEARPLQPNSTIVGIRIHSSTLPPRTPLHLGFILDVSGSMEGPRIEALQRTLELLIQSLQESDRLTLITYNAAATIVVDGCSEKATLLDHVKSLQAGGGTNMGAGLLALQELTEKPSAIFLLTDGHVNVGVRTVSGLSEIVRRVVPPTIPIYTVGYGEDHNADILQAIALLSRGSHTYAEAAEMLPAIAGDILVAAETCVQKGILVGATQGTIKFLELETVGQKYGEYYVGNLHTDKPQWVVLDADVEAQKTLTVRWDSAVGAVEIPLIPVREYQRDVAQQWFRARVTAALNEARQNRSRMSVGRLVHLEEEIRRSPVASEPLMITLLASVKEMLEILDKPNHQGIARMVSNITTLSAQRGIMAAPHVGGPLDSNATLFQSPRQRHVSSQLVGQFSQATPE